jgi:hypothetical protein
MHTARLLEIGSDRALPPNVGVRDSARAECYELPLIQQTERS